MSNKNRHLLNVLLGALMLFTGIMGLMGNGSKGFIPRELYIGLGIFLIGYGLWKYQSTTDE